MVVSTRNGQILVVNLYSQVYRPDLLKLKEEIKTVGEQEVEQVRTIGLFEENSMDCDLAEKQKDKITSTQAKKELDELEQ